MKYHFLLPILLLSAFSFAGCQSQTSSVADQASPAPVATTESAESATNTPADTDAETTDSYQPYSQAAVDEALAAGKKPVLFFHADWCPTCRAADADITSNIDVLPEDVVVFKTDFDSQSELKKEYEVVQQHSFVQLGADGEVVTQWVGGGAEIIATRVQ